MAGVVEGDVRVLAANSWLKIRMAWAAALALFVCLGAQAKQQTAGAPAASQASASGSSSSSTAAKTTTHKKKRHHTTASSSASKSSGSTSTTHTTTAKNSASRTASSRRKKTGRTRGQQKIDSDRAEEIQEALIREHYLNGEPTGKWNDACEAAMRKFQGDHGWQTKTVPDSRALIALGLGPSHDHLLNPESAMTTDAPRTASTNVPATHIDAMDGNKTPAETPAVTDPAIANPQ